MQPTHRPARGLVSLVAATCITVVLGACSSGDSSSSATTAVTSSSASAASAQVAKLLQDGISYAQNGQYDQSATTFANVLSLDPSNKFAFYNLGLIAQTRKDDKTAVDYYDKALQADAGYQPAMYNKAIILEGSNLDQAIAIYEKITQANDKASTAWFRLSICYGLKGENDKAKAARDKAIALDPSLANAPTTTAPPPAPATTTTPAPSTTTKR